MWQILVPYGRSSDILLASVVRLVVHVELLGIHERRTSSPRSVHLRPLAILFKVASSDLPQLGAIHNSTDQQRGTLKPQTARLIAELDLQGNVDQGQSGAHANFPMQASQEENVLVDDGLRNDPCECAYCRLRQMRRERAVAVRTLTMYTTGKTLRQINPTEIRRALLSRRFIWKIDFVGCLQVKAWTA